MALFEDRRKPVNIYDPESATGRVQSVNNRIAPVAVGMRGAANVADTISTPARALASTVTRPIVDARQRQNIALERRATAAALRMNQGGDMAGFRTGESRLAPRGDVATLRTAESRLPAPRINLDRQADAMLYGDQAKPVGGYDPAGVLNKRATAAVERGANGLSAGSGWMRNEQTGETVSVSGGRNAPLTMTNRDGQIIPSLSKRIETAMNKSNNYTFEGSPALRQRFENAVAKSEYDTESAGARALQNRQFKERMGYEEVDPNTNMTQSEMRGLKPELRLKAADILANRAAQMEKNKTDRLQVESAAQLGKDTLGLNRDKFALDSQAQGVETESKKFLLNQEKDVAGLMAKYDDPNTTPEERTRIERQLAIRGKYKPQAEKFQPITLKGRVNQDGSQDPETVVMSDNVRGVVRRADVGGGDPQMQAPPEAIARLKKFKDYDNFRAKYGYVPDGV